MWKPSSAERYLIDTITGWLLLASLVYAPFAYGSSRPDLASYLALWLAIVFGMTAIKWLFVERRLPRVGPIPLLLLTLVNVQGWVMVFDPAMLYDKVTWQFVMLQKNYPWLPGTVDRDSSMEGMWVISGLSLGYILLSDLASNPIWRKRLLLTMALTGTATALVGIVLKFGGIPLMEIVWNPSEITTSNFAFYRYHGNAAVLLYLTWPLCLAFYLGPLTDWKQVSQRFGWFFAFGVIFVAGMVNISKAGVMISTAMLALFIWWRWKASQRRKEVSSPVAEVSPLMRKVYFVMAVVIISCSLILIVSAALNSVSGWSRWFEEREFISFDRSLVDRILIYEAASESLDKAGWFGFGPDTFSLILPRYTAYLYQSQVLYGFWLYAHEDYLQTLMEWGRVGAGLWGLFYFGGMIRGFWNWRRADHFASSEDRMLLFACCFGLLAAAVHASFDFPFQIASLRLYLLALLAVCWNSHRYETEIATAPPKKIRRRKRE